MKTYVVFGGSRGIGAALVSILLKDGHSVLNVSRNDSEENHVNLSYHSLDVLEQDWASLPALQEIHGLAYCPGSIDLKPLRRVSVEDMEEAMDVNLYGALRAIQWAYPVMRKTPNAAVVLFSTVAVSQGMPFHTVVASAKGAVEGFTKSLAAEFAPKVRVNCIAPSLTDTELAGDLLRDDKRREASAERHPLKRIGQREDIAHAAQYLLGEESSWVTGQVLHVDGGMSSIRV
ncbi:MAG: SDR family oxidoreductase [Bacteroidota bacterium]|nr:SDR family oxidoreductase [Bacteroidota bacterium]MEC8032166.1 SDR family oxidoreductase [Bacteroidota bacterium]MEC9221996.1 SDR family oxidoreductase [Bacteroidota bacterium]